MPLKITKMDSYDVSKDGRVFATGIWRGIENREMKQWPNDDCGTSKQCIQQIEKKALEHLREGLRARGITSLLTPPAPK